MYQRVPLSHPCTRPSTRRPSGPPPRLFGFFVRYCHSVVAVENGPLDVDGRSAIDGGVHIHARLRAGRAGGPGPGPGGAGRAASVPTARRAPPRRQGRNTVMDNLSSRSALAVVVAAAAFSVGFSVGKSRSRKLNKEVASSDYKAPKQWWIDVFLEG